MTAAYDLRFQIGLVATTVRVTRLPCEACRAKQGNPAYCINCVIVLYLSYHVHRPDAQF